MATFILVFLIIYTLMHALVFWGMHPLLEKHLAVPTITWVWIVPMIVAPVAIRMLDNNGYELSARALSWVAFSWMGFTFIAFSLFALIGVWEILSHLVQKVIPALPRLSLHGPQSAALIFFITLCAGIYGFYEAANVGVERVLLTSDKLKPGSGKVVVAQVSDMHLGLLHREEALAPIVAKLRELKPDVVVATGDIVDAQISHLDELSSLWQDLRPKYGKYAVTGNHEYYAGITQAKDYLKKSGFILLENSKVKVGGSLLLAGVNDRMPMDETALLKESDQGLYTIFLKHKPLHKKEAAGLFDLQLSGHSHRGQIFPFNFLTGIKFPMQDGLYKLEKGSYLYTSRGTGSWGPPMRLLSPPEITLFEIYPPGGDVF